MSVQSGLFGFPKIEGLVMVPVYGPWGQKTGLDWTSKHYINCIVQHMKYSGGTFSGFKSALCTREITVLGHRCTPEGRLPDVMKVNKITNWSELFDLTDIRAFLG